MSNVIANREEAQSVSLCCTTGTGGADALPGRAQFKKCCGEFGSLFSENDYATARSKLLECRGLQLNGLSLLEQSCSTVLLEIVELRNLLESALQLLLNYEELVSILLLIGCIETKKRKMTDISVVNARKFFLGLRRLVDNLRNERKQNVHGKSSLKSKGVTDSSPSDVISASSNLLRQSNGSENDCNLGVCKESMGVTADTPVVTGREFLSLPPPDFNKFIPGRNLKVETSNPSLSPNECIDPVKARVGSIDRFMRVNGSRGTGEDGKEKEKDLEIDRDNASPHIKLGPMSAHTLSSGRKMMASIPMIPSTVSHYNHNHSGWRSDGLTQVLGARNGKSRLPALPSLSVSAASTAPASPCHSPSKHRGQVKGSGHFESSDRLEENDAATLGFRNHAAGELLICLKSMRCFLEIAEMMSRVECLFLLPYTQRDNIGLLLFFYPFLVL